MITQEGSDRTGGKIYTRPREGANSWEALRRIRGFQTILGLGSFDQSRLPLRIAKTIGDDLNRLQPLAKMMRGLIVDSIGSEPFL